MTPDPKPMLLAGVCRYSKAVVVCGSTEAAAAVGNLGQPLGDGRWLMHADGDQDHVPHWPDAPA